MKIQEVIINGDNVESYREEAKKAARKFRKLTGGAYPDMVTISDVNGVSFHCQSEQYGEALYCIQNGRMYEGDYEVKHYNFNHNS